MKKIISIVGARPQFIKCAPVSKELRKVFKEILVHTGQHYDYEMSKLFFDQLGIPKPKYNLGVGSLSHAKQTGRMLEKIEQVLVFERPDLVIIYGDTNSTLAGALAAVKLHIPVAHIEAGLRSFNKKMPEEINRLVSDHVSDILFAPSKTAIQNLAKEGIESKAYFSGDVMYDAVKQNINVASEKGKIFYKLAINKGEYFYVTIHRPYNVDDKKIFFEIIKAFNSLDHKVIFPIHPRARKNINSFGFHLNDNIILLKPVSYLDSLMLQKYAKKVITDSGGVQKEAYFLNTPCITLRPETEWRETVKYGANILVKERKEKKIIAALNKKQEWKFEPFYGNGKASEIILSRISQYLLSS